MRAKTLWNFLPLPTLIKLAYKRITLTRLTTAYALLAITFCLTQVALQTQTFFVNRNSRHFIRHVMSEAANGTSPTKSIELVQPDGSLKLCTSIPGESSTDPCTLIFDNTLRAANSKTVEKTKAKRDVTADHAHAKATFDASGALQSVAITGLQANTVTLSPKCIGVLPFVDQRLQDAQREDLTFVFYNIWTLGVAIAAILNESIPHIITNQLSLLLATIWAAVQITRSNQFSKQFINMVTNGSCGGIDLLPGYGNSRMVLQIPILAINGVTLLIFAFFSFKLFKIFGRQTFQRVGARAHMKKAYILVLIFSICLQLLALLLTSSFALWLDQVANGAIGQLVKHRTLYEVTTIIIFVIIFPWLITGWNCVRRERKKTTYAFLVICVIILATNLALFASAVYRLTYNTWGFFAVVSVAAFVVTVATFCVGVACLRNFGLGLEAYLNGEDILDGSEKVPWSFTDEEKAIGVPRVNVDRAIAQLRAPAPILAVPTGGSTLLTRKVTFVEPVVPPRGPSPPRSPSDSVYRHLAEPVQRPAPPKVSPGWQASFALNNNNSKNPAALGRVLNPFGDHNRVDSELGPKGESRDDGVVGGSAIRAPPPAAARMSPTRHAAGGGSRQLVGLPTGPKLQRKA